MTRSGVAALVLALAGSLVPAPAGAETAATAAIGLVDPGFLDAYTATHRFSLGRPRSVRVLPGGKTALFLRSGPRDPVRSLYALDLATGKERVLATAESLLSGGVETLSAEEAARRERMRLFARGIAGYAVSRDGTKILVPLSGRLFVRPVEGGKTLELAGEGTALDPRFSPDGKWVAAVRDGDLWLHDAAGRGAVRVTRRETDEVRYGESEFVAQEEMGRMEGYWFSPDSRKLAFQRTDVAGVDRFRVADPMKPEHEPEAWPYPRAGRKNAEVRLFVAGVPPGPAGGPPVAEVSRSRRGAEGMSLGSPAAASPARLPPDAVEVRWDRERFPYLARVVWEEGGPLSLLVQDRRLGTQRLLAADPVSGETRMLVEESDPNWVELPPGVPAWLPDGDFLWASEVEAGWRLERRAGDGALRKVLATPATGFVELAGVLPGGRLALVVLAPTPTRTQPAALDLATGELRPLVEAPGFHGVEIAPGEPLGRLSLLPRQGPGGVVFTDGSRVLTYRPRSRSEEPAWEPRPEWIRTGLRRLHAVVVRPRDFDPALRYPVVVDVYGGPTHGVVAEAGRFHLMRQWLADQGFVVVAGDGRGTPGRGRSWHRAVDRDFATVPVDDQAALVRSLARRYPELDPERVGISGWSFGGYLAAMAAMRRPEAFHAAVAGAPVADWRDYDSYYTEKYLDLPELAPEAYRVSSLLEAAPSLTRPLLLIHGTSDDNVWFLHSLKLAKALFEAGRGFEFLPLSGFTHMVPDPLVARRLQERIVGFLKRSLGEPRRR